MNMTIDFNEYIQESQDSKNELIEFLMDIDEQTETPLEAELLGLIISLIKMERISEDSFDSIYDAIDEIVDFENQKLGYDYDDFVENIDDEFDEIVDEKQRSLYLRAGYVKCPSGKIRKRGKCGKPLDRKKSRKMIRARKKFKRSFAKGVRKAKRTKRRLGMIK